MSATKQISQDYCLLIAICKDDNSDDAFERKLQKAFKDSYVGMDELKKAATACAQQCCIVITNDHSWLISQLKKEYDKVKSGTFFIVSTHSAPAIIKGRVNKIIHHIVQPDTPYSSAQEALKAVKRAKRLQEKAVDHFLKNKLKKQFAPEQSNRAFLENLNKLIKRYHADSNLRTTFLAEKMGISQSTLERRCHKITQKKPNHILLEYRLAQAHKYSTQSLMPFAKIAKICGFGSAAYFSVRFTDYFKIKPSQARVQAQSKAS